MNWLMSRTSIAAAILSIAAATPSSALEPSGKTIRAIPAASASGVSGTRILRVQSDIFMGDEVKTGPVGEAQVLFRDDTRLVVGPNSRMVVDKFVFNPNGSAREVTMSAAKGAFRFISGRSAKQAYSIRTPVLTIGVRGTEFDFAVRPGGETSFALFHGAATLCDRGGQCIEVREGCNVVVAPPGGGFQDVGTHRQRLQRIGAYFPYIRSQERLAPQFRVNTTSCNAGPGNLQERRTNDDDIRSERPARPERPEPVVDIPEEETSQLD